MHIILSNKARIWYLPFINNLVFGIQIVPSKTKLKRTLTEMMKGIPVKISNTMYRFIEPSKDPYKKNIHNVVKTKT